MRRIVFCCLCLSLTIHAAAILVAPAPWQQGLLNEGIERVRGDLYRARTGAYNVLFLVTPDGIILADTISTEFSTWLKKALAQRFGVPVRYVIYSHNHFDHVSGGKIFADTARFIAHENMLKAMDGRIPGMPGGMIDRNNNGVFEPEEIFIPRCGIPRSWFEYLDKNHDGILTPKEVYAEVHPPDIVYSGRMRLSLGGKAVELIHPGKNHSDDLTVVYFPAERTVFTAEILPGSGRGTRMWPIACTPFNYNPLSEWIKSFRTIEALDFDILFGSHEEQATKADAIVTRTFYERVISEVAAGMSHGKSLEDLKKTLAFEEYANWQEYEIRRPLTIEAVWENLRLYRD